jgi:hypothetical protein
MNLMTRTNFSEELRNWGDVEMPQPAPNSTLLDYEVRLDDQSWHLWRKRVPNV